MSAPKKASDYPFHVVEFINRGVQPKNKSLDVVRTKWFKREGKKTRVYFPKPPYTQESFASYNEYLAEDKDAPTTWGLFSMKVRDRADTFDEALARLAALKDGAPAFSLSDGSISDYEKDVGELVHQNDLQSQAALLLDSYQPAATANSISSEAPSEHVSPGVTSSAISQPNNNGDPSNPNSKTHISSSRDGNSPAGASHTSNIDPTESSRFHGVRSSGSENNAAQTQAKKSTTKHSRVSNGAKDDTKNKSSRVLKGLLKQITVLTTEVKELTVKIQTLDENITQIKAASFRELSGKITESFVGTPKQIGTKYGYKIPFETLEEFEQFDLALRNTDPLYHDVSVVLQSGLDITYVISKSVVKMLKMFLTKKVAMEFVAKRETSINKLSNNQNNKIKKPLNKTKFYEIIDVIIRNHRSVGNQNTGLNDIQIATGTVLSNSRQWKESYFSDTTASSPILDVKSDGLGYIANNSATQGQNNQCSEVSVVYVVEDQVDSPPRKQRKLDSDELIIHNGFISPEHVDQFEKDQNDDASSSSIASDEFNSERYFDGV